MRFDQEESLTFEEFKQKLKDILSPYDYEYVMGIRS